MIEVSARVTALDGAHAIVSISETGCGRCHEPGGCGGNQLGQMFCSTPKNYRVLNPRHAHVGEIVTVVIMEHAVFHSAMAAYVYPMAALFTGALLGWWIANEMGSIIGACGGLIAGWTAMRLSARKLSNSDPKSLPYIK